MLRAGHAIARVEFIELPSHLAFMLIYWNVLPLQVFCSCRNNLLFLRLQKNGKKFYGIFSEKDNKDGYNSDEVAMRE